MTKLKWHGAFSNSMNALAG